MEVRRTGGPRRGRRAGWRVGWAIVRGRSMEPGLREGDRLLVHYAATPRAGQVVVARFADGTLAVKRAAERRTTRTGEPGWWLLSDNPAEGVDSRHRGVVADGEVLGVARLRVRRCRIHHIPALPSSPEQAV